VLLVDLGVVVEVALHPQGILAGLVVVVVVWG